MAKKTAPCHPGETIKEDYLVPRGSQRQPAREGAGHHRCTTQRNRPRGRRGITADTALRLARYFRTSPHFWMNLQSIYDLQLADGLAGPRIAKEVRPRQAA